MERTGEPGGLVERCLRPRQDGSSAHLSQTPWKRHYSVFAPHLSPTVLRAASQAALQRENLTSLGLVSV